MCHGFFSLLWAPLSCPEVRNKSTLAIHSVPPWTRGDFRGVFLLQQPPPNRIQHIIQLVKHFNISKPKKINAEGLDKGFTDFVSRLRSILKVTVSVDFDSKPELSAIEVNHIGTHTVLSTKLVTKQLSSTQLRPK